MPEQICNYSNYVQPFDIPGISGALGGVCVMAHL